MVTKVSEIMSILVNDPVADSEHLEILGLTNLIYEYIVTGKNHNISPTIIILTTKLLLHCESEEGRLKYLQGPEETYSKHKEAHRVLIDSVVSYLKDITIYTLPKIELLVKEHIQNYDIPDFLEASNAFQKKKD